MNNLPSNLSDLSLSELLKQPGTKATFEAKDEKQTVTIKRKESESSFQAKIDIYSDGTQTKSLTTSPNIPAKEKNKQCNRCKQRGKRNNKLQMPQGHHSRQYLEH